MVVDGDRDTTKCDGSGSGIMGNRPDSIETSNGAEARGSPPVQCVSSDRTAGAGVKGKMNASSESSADMGRGISHAEFGDASAKATSASGGGGVDNGTNGTSTTGTKRNITGTSAESTIVGGDREDVHDAWVGAPLAETSVANTTAHASGAHMPSPIPVATAAAPTEGAMVTDATLVGDHDEDNDSGGHRGLASLVLSTLRDEGVAELLASPLLWYAVQWARSQNPVFHTSYDELDDGDGGDVAGEEGDSDHHRAGWHRPRGGTTLRIFLGLLAEAVEAHWNVRSLRQDYAEWKGDGDGGEEGEYEDFDGQAEGWRNRQRHPYMGRSQTPPSRPLPAVRGGASSAQQRGTGSGSGGGGVPLSGSARCDGAAEKIMYFLTALECVDPALETWARSLHPLLLCLGARRRVASTDVLGDGSITAGHKTTGAYHYWNVLCKVAWVKFVARAALLSAENLSRWLKCQQGGHLEEGRGGGQTNFDVTCLKRGGTLPPLGGGTPTPSWGPEEDAEMPYHQQRRRQHHRNNHHHRRQQNGWHGYYDNQNPRYRRHPRRHQEEWQQQHHHHKQQRHHHKHQQHQHDRRYHRRNNRYPDGHRHVRQHTQQQHWHQHHRQVRHGPASYPASERKPSHEHDCTEMGMGNGRPSDHAHDYVGRRTGRRLGAGAGHSGWNSRRNGGGEASASASGSPRRPWLDNGCDGDRYGRQENLAHEQCTLPVAQSHWEGRPHSTTRRRYRQNDRENAIPADHQTSLSVSPLAVRTYRYKPNDPSALRPRSRLRLAIAEILHIARPLIWTALQTRATLPDERDGREGGTMNTKSGGGKGIRHTRARLLTKIWPWILTLAVDVVSLWLMSTCGDGRNAPLARAAASPPGGTKHTSEEHDHEGGKGGNEDLAVEARRRRARLWLYLLRSPAWDWATGPATRVAARLVAGAMPLFGLGPAAAGSFLSWLEYWRSNHCVLEGHHHAAAHCSDPAATPGRW